jgi:hypothetical protein
MFSHITMTLMQKGYMVEENRKLQIKIPNLLDLLNQAVQIVKRADAKDWFYSGRVELPSGEKTKVFIAQNETGRFTIMLPEDY